MRSTFLKLIFSALILQSVVLYAFERNFGDEVVECVSKIHPPLGSPELPKILAQCEKEVTEKRGPNDHDISRTTNGVEHQKDSNPFALENLPSPAHAPIAHGGLQNVTYIEMFVDSMFFWIGENALSIGLAVVGYLIRGTIGAVIVSILTSLITGFGLYEARYLKEHGIDSSDTVRFAHALNDPVFMNDAKTHALLGSIKFSLLNAIIIFTFFFIISNRSSIVNLCKKYIHALGNFRFEGNFNYLFDVVVLIAIPFLIVTLLRNYYLIENDTKTALLAALITAVLAYCSAFTFQGNYSLTSIRLRLSVFRPALFLSIIYWLGMVFTHIADREGSGNVIAMLFGLAVVGAVAWNRIKKLDQ